MEIISKRAKVIILMTAPFWESTNNTCHTHMNKDLIIPGDSHYGLGPCPTIRIWTRSVPKFMSWYFLATSVTNSWHFLTLLDDSWTVGRTKIFWKFVEHVQKMCDSLISLARSWTLLGPSWQHLSGFLMVSQLFLTRLGRYWRERKIGVNEKELVKNSQEESRSWQEHVSKS